MAHFYGRVRGRGVNDATREGTKDGGLVVYAQAHSGDIRIEMRHSNGKDHAYISASNHGQLEAYTLFDGPIELLLTREGRKVILERLAREALKEECNG